jgi:hypothetical protein
MTSTECPQFTARLFSGSFGYEGRRDFDSLAAAKRYASQAQRAAGYGWHAEILNSDGALISYRAYSQVRWQENA